MRTTDEESAQFNSITLYYIQEGQNRQQHCIQENVLRRNEGIEVITARNKSTWRKQIIKQRMIGGKIRTSFLKKQPGIEHRK